MTKVFIILLIFLNGVWLIGSEENAETNLFKNLKINLYTGSIYHSKKNLEVLVPDYFRNIEKEKRLNRLYSRIDHYKKMFETDAELNEFLNYQEISISDATNKLFRVSGDSPLYHGAYYLDFDIETNYKGFKLKSNLIFEHRSMSWGVYSSSAIKFYPKLRLSYNYNITKNLSTGVSIGNSDDFKLYEGLRIFNLDLHTTNVYFKWNKIKFEFNRIADLTVGVGLYIDDVSDYILSFNSIKLLNNWKFDLKLGLSAIHYSREPIDLGYFYSVSGHISNDNIGFYLQYSQRSSTEVEKLLNENDIPVDNKNGLLAGFKSKINLEKFSLRAAVEYRYYSSFFNTFFKNENNDYFYYYEKVFPVSHINRPFAQWAVYTDYQFEMRAKELYTYIVRLDSEYKINKNLFLKSNLDFNYIKVKDEEKFIYPFYIVNFGYMAFKNTGIMIGITNKGLNLDKHYPTFYQYKRPTISITMFSDLNIK